MNLCDRKFYLITARNKQWLLLLATTLPLSLALLFYSNSSIAQEVNEESSIEQVANINQNIIYVNPQRGTDNAVGSQNAPLKTITQALRIAQPNTTISLSPGTYNQATGETFPLIVKSDITLQGTPGGQGRNIIIEGSGSFISPTAAEQNVTIAAIKNAGTITGITVTNPHTRGHGLWIESASPKVTHSSFLRNGNTGVSVNGNSNPIISNNYFFNNAGNGLLIYGTSKPQVTNNVFERTGFGVSIVQSAAPNLIDNHFKGNRIGVILEGNAQGILRNNTIINSSEYGLVAIASARVDLGTNEEPGSNVFRNNGKFDIQNITHNPISAVGTEIAGKTEGIIDLTTTASSSIATKSTVTHQNNPTIGSISRLREIPLAPANNPVNNNNNSQPQPQRLATSESLITSKDTLPPPPSFPDDKSTELVFSAPNNNASEENILPVPNVEPPLSSFLEPPNAPDINRLGDVLTPFNTAAAVVKYRVLVEAVANSQQNQVRSLYPDAFQTVYQGKTMLQVGAFSDRSKAEITSRSLANLGLNSFVLE